MKKTKISTDGTSYYGSSVTATLAQMRKAVGAPAWEDNKGFRKVNFEWERETETGLVFTVYDWKYYRPIEEDDDIQWNIGGHSKDATEAAKGEIEDALDEGDGVSSYFIFGKAAVELYGSEREDLEKVAEAINSNEGAICKFNIESTTPTEFLSAFLGWNDFATIEYREYKAIKALLNPAF